MIALTSILTFLGLIVFVIFIIVGIIQLIRKKSAKKSFIIAATSFGAFIVFMFASIALATNPKSDDVATETNEQVEKTDESTEDETNTSTTEDETEVEQTETEEKVEEVEKEEEEEEEEPALNEIDKSEYTILEDSQLDGMKRKPEEHYGELVKFSGKVIQVSSGEIEYIEYYRVAIDDNYDHVVLVKVLMPNLIEAGRILEDDYVTLYSKYEGLNTYESTTGKSVTLPYFSTFGKTIELSSK